MLKWLIAFFLGRSLDKHLRATKKIQIKGITFTIKKISGIDHIEGFQVLQKVYDLKRQSANQIGAMPKEQQLKKMRAHYADIMLAGVVHPKIAKTSDGDPDSPVSVDEMFQDWEMVGQLYTEIVEFTYGKKKTKFSSTVIE